MTRVYRTAASSNRSAANWHHQGPHGGSACSSLNLALDVPQDPADVPATLRCRANGCRQRWERWLQEVQS